MSRRSYELQIWDGVTCSPRRCVTGTIWGLGEMMVEPQGAECMHRCFSPRFFLWWTPNRVRWLRFIDLTNRSSVRVACAERRRPLIGRGVFFSKGAYFSCHLDWIFSLIQGPLIRYLRDFAAHKLTTGIIWKVESTAMTPARLRVCGRSHGGGVGRWRWRCRSRNDRLAKLRASMSASAVASL